MAAAFGPFDDEFDDLLQCIICQEEYDTADRLPKFLDCTHTFCLKCIKAWVKSKVIDCPVCRDVTHLVTGVADLKNNRYSLKQLESKRNKNIDNYIGDFLWCLRCGRTAQMDCSTSAHSLLTVSSKQMLQELIQLNESILQCKVNWSQIINIRRTFQQSKLDCVAKAMKAALNDINSLSEENELQMARAESLLNIHENFGLINRGTLNIAERKAQYALGAQESEAVLRETRETVKQFNVLQDWDYHLVARNGVTSCNFNLEFDESDPYKTIAAFALTTFLKNRLPDCQSNGVVEASFEAAAAVDQKQTVRDAKADEFVTVPGGKNKKKESNNYATALKHPPSSVSRPMSSSQKGCYLDIDVDGKAFGRVVVLLATDVAPEMCKVFMKACRGHGITYKDTKIFQTKENEFICGGSMEETKLPKLYIPDRSTMKDERGAIRMRRRDDVKEKVILVSTEFHIILSKGPQFSYRFTTVFGRVIEGLDVCDDISHINPMTTAITIRDCGVL